MIITYEGQRYEFDFEDITVKQAIKIEKHTGMGLSEWGKAVAEGAGATAAVGGWSSTAAATSPSRTAILRSPRRGWSSPVRRR